MNNKHMAIIALGSNLSKDGKTRLDFIKTAIGEIGKIVKVTKISKFYQSPAWPKGNDSPDYINCAILVETDIQPLKLLEKMQEIELMNGRVRNPNNQWAARTLDVDIISIDNLIINSDNLKIPHPRMTQRDFVLLPLNDIEPDWVHPLINKSIKELIADYINDNKNFSAKAI